MSPLRKYTPRSVPKDRVHPVETMLSLIGWGAFLALVVFGLRWIGS